MASGIALKLKFLSSTTTTPTSPLNEMVGDSGNGVAHFFAFVPAAPQASWVPLKVGVGGFGRPFFL